MVTLINDIYCIFPGYNLQYTYPPYLINSVQSHMLILPYSIVNNTLFSSLYLQISYQYSHYQSHSLAFNAIITAQFILQNNITTLYSYLLSS